MGNGKEQVGSGEEQVGMGKEQVGMGKEQVGIGEGFEQVDMMRMREELVGQGA